MSTELDAGNMFSLPNERKAVRYVEFRFYSSATENCQKVLSKKVT